MSSKSTMTKTAEIAGIIAVLIAIIALLKDAIQLRQNLADSKDRNQAQATVATLLESQLQVLEQIATFQARNIVPGPTATAVAQTIVPLQSTVQALEQEKLEAQRTLTPQARTTQDEATVSPSTETPMPLLSIGSEKVRPQDDAVMVYVPADQFTMGSTTAEIDHATDLCNSQRGQCPTQLEDEFPAHTVFLDAFWIDKYEVTNAQFSVFANQTGHQTEAEKKGCGDTFDFAALNWKCVDGADWRHPLGPDTDINGKDDHPVVMVSWNDAQAYCQWAGGQLPTEAQWEKAARGQDRRLYPWGYEFDPARLNFCDANCDLAWRDNQTNDGYPTTAPVGSFSNGASPYGAMDMSGNVWEWVADWYGKDYYQRLLRDNPQGPETGRKKVARGGSWDNASSYLRITQRLNGEPGITSGLAGGFRCAAPAVPNW